MDQTKAKGQAVALSASGDNPVRVRNLFERYRPALFAYFTHRVRSSSEADDLVQDVFVRLSRLDASMDIHNPEAFIFRTAVNLLRDRARRRKARRETAEFDALGFELSDEEPGIERVLEARAELSEVITALKGLSERTRNIFILRRLELVKVAEIAMFYGISISAAEHHITKAQAHLARTIRRS
jgi:RNA polymerase sigma-70 factor (ECF subfamily)